MPKKTPKWKQDKPGTVPVKKSTARKTTTPAVVEHARTAAPAGGRARARKRAEAGLPQRVLSAEQEEKMLREERLVLEQRTRGLSFYRIEKEFGVSNAARTFRRALARDENVEFQRKEALRLEEERLDRLQDGLWDRALSGEPRAVEVVLKVLERRARLLGLDFADTINGRLVEIEQAKTEVLARALVEVLRGLGLPPEQEQAATAQLFERVRALSPQTAVPGEIVHRQTATG